ncbi:MAG: hypothetical protein KJ070_14020 [Verrucomicrobia bacterium]|nr:hypothetical protein [Verrucomicrobiota bacterium]
MKALKAIRFGPALLGLLLLSATAANAHTVRSRPACGVVERLDMASRTVQFSPNHGKAPTDLALTSQTKFIRNWHFAPADELKDGTRAVVYYRTPFFGRPFVTKVVWVNGI